MKKLDKQAERLLVKAILKLANIDNEEYIATAYNEKPDYYEDKETLTREDWGAWDASGLALHDDYNLEIYSLAAGEAGRDSTWGRTIYLTRRNTGEREVEINFDGQITCRQKPEPWRDYHDDEPEYEYTFEPLTEEDIDNGKYKIEY